MSIISPEEYKYLQETPREKYPWRPGTFANSQQAQQPIAPVTTIGPVGDVLPGPKFTGVSTPQEVHRAYTIISGGGARGFKVRKQHRRKKTDRTGAEISSRSAPEQTNAGNGGDKETVRPQTGRKNPIWLKKYQFKKGGKK